MSEKYTQPAEVTAEPDLASYIVNEACWKFIEAMPHELPGPIWNNLKPALYASLIYYHRAILAMRPVQVPMTQEQIMEAEQSSYVDSRKPVYTTDCWGDEKIEYEPTKYFNMFTFARAIEAHHGIAQAKKEAP